jgi:hypothetical protein
LFAVAGFVGCTNSSPDSGIVVGTTFEVTPDGGTFDTGEGVTLLIPLGAVAQAVTVTVTKLEDADTTDWIALSPVFQFKPEGLEFLQPVKLRMTYSFEGDETPVMQLLWTTKDDPTVYAALAGATFAEGVAEGKIEHFSMGFVGTPDVEPQDGDEPDGDLVDGDEIDGDLADGDVVDGDEIDGDLVDGDVVDGDEEEPEPTPITNPTVIVDSIQFGGGFDFNGDDTVDNAIGALDPEAQILNAAVTSMLETGWYILLLHFEDMSELPAPGTSNAVTLAGIYGKDLDENYENNFDGETFGVNPLTFDENGNYRLRFENVGMETALDGTTHIFYEQDPLELVIERATSETIYDLTIRHFRLDIVLAEDQMDQGWLIAPEGMFGGVIPFALIETYNDDLKEALGINIELKNLYPYVDIDLNDDDVVSHDAEGNPDGISMGALLTAAKAVLQPEEEE